jgi:hypothetical protein
MFENQKIGITTKDGMELQEGDVLETPNGDWGIIRYDAPGFGLTGISELDLQKRIFIGHYAKEWLERCKYIGNANDKPVLVEILKTKDEQKRVLALKNIDYEELRKTYITL